MREVEREREREREKERGKDPEVVGVSPPAPAQVTNCTALHNGNERHHMTDYRPYLSAVSSTASLTTPHHSTFDAHGLVNGVSEIRPSHMKDKTQPLPLHRSSSHSPSMKMHKVSKVEPPNGLIVPPSKKTTVVRPFEDKPCDLQQQQHQHHVRDVRKTAEEIKREVVDTPGPPPHQAINYSRWRNHSISPTVKPVTVKTEATVRTDVATESRVETKLELNLTSQVVQSSASVPDTKEHVKSKPFLQCSVSNGVVSNGNIGTGDSSNLNLSDVCVQRKQLASNCGEREKHAVSNWGEREKHVASNWREREKHGATKWGEREKRAVSNWAEREKHKTSNCGEQEQHTDCGAAMCQEESVVSKLDMEASKRQRRLKQGLESSDSEDETIRKELLLLTTGPPLELHITPKKVNFMSILGLVTQDKWNEAELSKCERRHALFGTCPMMTPPLPERPVSAPSFGVDPWSSLLSRPSVEKMCRSPDFPSKIRFLRALGLEVTSAKSKELTEKMWQGILAERYRRESRNGERRKRTWEVAFPQPVAATAQSHPAQLPQTQPQPQAKPPLPKLMIVKNAKTLKPSVMLKVPSAPPSHEVKTIENNMQTSSARDRSPVENKALPTRLLPLPALPPPEREKRMRWVGVEATIESYHRHVQEQHLERGVLQEQCDTLRCRNSQLQQAADSLSRRVSELLSVKKNEEGQRQRLEATIAGLKATLGALR